MKMLRIVFYVLSVAVIIAGITLAALGLCHCAHLGSVPTVPGTGSVFAFILLFEVIGGFILAVIGIILFIANKQGKIGN